MSRRLYVFVFAFVFILGSSDLLDAKAQFFSDEEFGGSAKCRLSGNVDGFKRKIKVSGENAIAVDPTLGDELIEFEFEGGTQFRGSDIFLSLFVPLLESNTDLFFEGNIHEETNDEIEFVIEKEDGDEFVEITNLSDENELANPIVTVQIQKLKNQSAYGVIQVDFPETVIITDNGFEEQEAANGEVTVTCKFSRVPAYLDQ